MLKYTRQSILCFIILLFTIRCFPQNSSDNDTKSQGSAARLKVAMVMPGDPETEYWSREGHEGLLALKEKYGAHIAFSVESKAGPSGEHFRRYARDGYHLLIGYGTQYVKIMEEVADEFPHTQFMITTHYPGNNRNFGSISFREAEISFLSGVVAGLKSETAKVGFITGPRYSSTHEMARSFKKGLLFVRPEAKISVAYLGGWYNTAEGLEIADKMIAAGCDIIAPWAGGATLEIIKRLGQSNVFATASNEAEIKFAPKTVLSGRRDDIALILEQGFKLVRDARWQGKLYQFGLHEGMHDLILAKDLLTAEQQAVMQQIKLDIINGKIEPLAVLDR